MVDYAESITKLKGELDVIKAFGFCILDIDHLADLRKAIKAMEETPPPCPEDCRWRGRHQKCSCCARNKYIKDCYEKEDKE